MDRGAPGAGPVVDFLAVGHLTRDLTPAGSRLGGAVAYAACLARQVGLRAAIVTSAGPDADLTALAGIPVRVLPAPVTTCYENAYEPSGRRQRLLARAAPIAPDDVPPAWRSARIALIGPVAGEVETIPLRPPGSITGLGLQGWLRSWDDRGHVRFRRWEDPDALMAAADVTFLSEEDVAQDPAAWDFYRARARCLVVTRGPNGCAIVQSGRVDVAVPGCPAREVDPTGAGDVFAAAFLIRYDETRDLREAAAFANAAAALSVEGEGLRSIPDRDAIARRRSVPNLIPNVGGDLPTA